MRPKSYASSTIGVKKSTVATMARSGVNWYTAASSRVEASTRMRGSVIVGTWRKTCANSAGPSLQAQPAPCESAVRRMVVIGPAKIATKDARRAGLRPQDIGPDHRSLQQSANFLASHRVAYTAPDTSQS